MNQHRRGGYFYAFGAALALSASFVFSKSVLNQVSMVQFGFVWFLLGVVWNSAWYISQKQYKQFKINTKQRLRVAVSIAILEAENT